MCHPVPWGAARLREDGRAAAGSGEEGRGGEEGPLAPFLNLTHREEGPLAPYFTHRSVTHPIQKCHAFHPEV